jgi:very-short-patch-repair endonuclease
VGYALANGRSTQCILCSQTREGRHEKQILDDKEKELGIKIIRQFQVLGYYVDGYCKETNTVYEVNEYHHYTSAKKIEADRIRQQAIIDVLHCEFVIIKDNC